MAPKSLVKAGMLPISSTSTVEAIEANIEAGGIILEGKSDSGYVQSRAAKSSKLIV